MVSSCAVEKVLCDRAFSTTFLGQNICGCPPCFIVEVLFNGVVSIITVMLIVISPPGLLKTSTV